MACEEHTSSGDSDRVELTAVMHPFDHSAAAWLVGQAVRYLNTVGPEGEFEYSRVVDVLRRCSGDVLDTMTNIFRRVKGGDTPLRWNLLYVLGDVGDQSAADFVVGEAVRPLPEKKDGEGCESERDMEMLVSTQAVHALHRIATRHAEVADAVLRVISERPARPILIEAVKVAVELGLRERVEALLPKEEQWTLDIRRARHQELFADPEREDGKERGFTPPKSGALYTAPSIVRCLGKEG